MSDQLPIQTVGEIPSMLKFSAWLTLAVSTIQAVFIQLPPWVPNSGGVQLNIFGAGVLAALLLYWAAAMLEAARRTQWLAHALLVAQAPELAARFAPYANQPEPTKPVPPKIDDGPTPGRREPRL